MGSEILFSEKQRFKQWWLWLILLSITGLLLFGVVKQVVYGEQFGDKPMSNSGLLILTSIFLLFTFLFVVYRLDTIIKKEGIYVRFFPFHIKFKYYSWNILTKSYIRKYSAVNEYGGWGLTFGIYGNGPAFNVSGDMGLQLEFANNKKLLIGTNKPDELKLILNEMGQLKQ